MKKLKALDLFCGAGGTSKGLVDAGFDVTGIDIKDQPEYPFKFIKMDATKVTLDFLKEFDFIWSSPPCQLFSIARNLGNAQGNKCSASNLIPETRKLLELSGKPFVIENVPKSPLRKDLMLCGSMFGLKVRRHRIFEMNFKCDQPKCNHKKQGRPVGVYHVMNDNIPNGGRTAKNLKEGQDAMGINWMSWSFLKEAIPPAYSYYIAKCFLLVSHKSHTLASPTFPTEKAINRNLQVTPSATPKEATLPSVNSDIKRNNTQPSYKEDSKLTGEKENDSN